MVFQNFEDPQDSFNFKCWFHQSYRGTKLEESTRLFLRNSPKSCYRFVFCFFNYDIWKMLLWTISVFYFEGKILYKNAFLC